MSCPPLVPTKNAQFTLPDNPSSGGRALGRKLPSDKSLMLVNANAVQIAGQAIGGQAIQ
jgi:hypothetical protein